MSTRNYNSMSYQPRKTTFINHIGLTVQPEFVKSNQNGKTQFFYPDDSRTKDPFRGLETQLDKPSYVGCIDQNKTGVELDNSAYKYSSYDGYGDINNSQIAYYIDPSISQPYNSSVYTIPGTTKKHMLVDPMGANKPQYKKIPYSTTLNAVSNYQTTRDILSHREGLMALQSRKRDQQSYVYFNSVN